MDKPWGKYCCNPFNRDRHWVAKNLRKVTSWMIKLNDSIKDGMKICTSCRLELSKIKTYSSSDSDSNINDEPMAKNVNPEPGCSKEDSNYMDVDTGLDYLNASLTSIGESPVVKTKTKTNKKYCKEKLEKVTLRLSETYFQSIQEKESKDLSDNSQTEIIDQLKEKFAVGSKSEKLQILTVLPKSWSCARMEHEFSISNYMARKAKKLLEEKGVLSTPDPKPGKTLPPETAVLVKEFYSNDEVSRQMPGKKDYVSMGKDTEGRPIHVQKRLILGNLREIYSLFKSKFPNIKIGFSKFVELRPKNCIIAGASGTHSVCVCTAHQNMKLMFSGGKLNKLTLPDSEIPLTNYKECIARVMCNPPLQTCFLNECDYCPKIEDFKNHLIECFEAEMIDNITYKQWITVDRCNFETFYKPVDEFVEEFCKQLRDLKKHDFVAKQQSSFFSEKKSLLQENEIVITCDFAENYSFVLQDEAQGFHWNNSMATVHPFVVYFKEVNPKTGQPELVHRSFVFISDCLTHNTVLVHAFQRKLLPYLRNYVPNLKKLYYFSDGSAAQYKNRKNFLNLCHHKEDFDGLEAEWHFYATSHGKGVCDGVGGTVKRLAAKASLQNPIENQILTPLQLFQWSEKNLPSIKFFYVTNEDFVSEEKVLKSRFEEAVAVSGTQKYHAFIPLETSRVKTKFYSFSDDFETHKVQISPGAEDIPFEEIVGFVACAYDNEWWLAHVNLKDNIEKEITVSFLHPKGPATSFTYPRRLDTLTVPVNYILCQLNPTTATGRTYQVPIEEMAKATQILGKKRNQIY